MNEDLLGSPVCLSRVAAMSDHHEDKRSKRSQTPLNDQPALALIPLLELAAAGNAELLSSQLNVDEDDERRQKKKTSVRHPVGELLRATAADLASHLRYLFLRRRIFTPRRPQSAAMAFCT